MMDNLNSNLLGNVEIFSSSTRRRLLSEVTSAAGLESSTEWRKDLFYFLCFFLSFMNVFGSCRTLFYIHKMKRLLCFTIPCNVDLKYLDMLHSLVCV